MRNVCCFLVIAFSMSCTRMGKQSKDNKTEPGTEKSCTISTEHKRSLAKIKNKKFKLLLGCFPFINTPFKLSYNASENTPLTNEELFFFITEEEQKEQLGCDTYYPAFVFYQNDRIGCILLRNYSPGAFGVNNDVYELYLFDYHGTLIKKEEIGCNCYDSNMGSNDYYSTVLDSVFVDKQRIRIYSRQEYGTLMQEEKNEMPDFYEEKSDSSIILY